MSQNIDMNAAVTDDGAKTYGFAWYADSVAKGTGTNKVDLGLAPRVTVFNLSTFRDAFGDDVILNAVNGTSLDVKIEGICRAMLLANRRTTIDDMRREVVTRALMGARAVGGPRGTRIVERIVEKTVVSYGGATFDSAADAARAAMDDFVSAGTDVKMAATFVSRMFPTATETVAQYMAEQLDK